LDKKSEDYKNKRNNIRKIEKEIKALESKIITEDLDIATENEYVAKIQELEKKKAAIDIVIGNGQENKKLKSEINDLNNQVKLLNDEITLYSKEAQNYHSLITDSYKENDINREQIQKLEKEILESKVIANEYHNKYREMNKRSKLKTKIRKGDIREKIEAKKEISEEILKEALDKKKKGQKLNIFEARALFESTFKEKE